MIQSLEALALIVATLVFMVWVDLWYGGNREQKQDLLGWVHIVRQGILCPHHQWVVGANSTVLFTAPQFQIFFCNKDTRSLIEKYKLVSELPVPQNCTNTLITKQCHRIAPTSICMITKGD